MDGSGARRVEFAGRAADLAAIEGHVKRARGGGHGATVLVEGEAGIGKSSILDAVVSAATASGVAAVVASASLLDRVRPFGPLIDAFALDPASRARVLPAAIAAQRAELGDLLDQVAATTKVSPLQLVPAERAYLIERLAATVESWSLEHPVLFAIDDLHWADPGTLATLGRLHRIVASQSLVIVAAFRPVPTNPELRDLVGTTVAHGAELHVLGPLAPDAVRCLVVDTVGAEPGPALLRAAARAGGNPFLVIELVHALEREGRIDVEDGVAELAPAAADQGVATVARDAILTRMTDLGPEARHFIQIGASLGRSFAVSDVAAMLGRPVAALLPLISTAVSAGLLEEDGQELRFRHDLVREAVESTIGGPALAALHLDIARTLAASGAPAVRVAAHYALGALPGDRTAVEWLRAAAATIVGRAPTSAAELLERALELTSIGDRQRDAILAELVDAAFWGGDVDRAATLAGTALSRPLPPTMAAGLHETMARALVVLGRPAEAVPHADQLVALGENPAWSLALSSVFKLFAMDLDGAVSDAQDAVTRCEQEGDDWAETLAYCVASWEQNARGFHRHAVELADRAVVAADRSADGEAHRLVPHLFRGLALESAGRTAEAQATLAHGQQLAEHLGTAWATPFYHYASALTPWNCGQWDAVGAEIDAGLRYAREHDIGLVASWACALGATALLFRGEHGAAEELLDEGDQQLASGGIQYGVDWLLRGRALLLEARGDPAGAVELLRLGWDVAEGLNAAAALVLLGPDLVRIALDVGDQESAALAARALARDAVDDSRMNVDAHALRCRGMVERDVDLLLEARRIHTDCERPVEVIQDDEAMVLALARLGRMEDAAARLDICIDGCEAIGAVLVSERVRRAAARFGITRPKRRSGRPVSGWGALTETEALVASLVAAGRSNPQVAAELLISRRTVESHLYRIFFKLGVSNRTELAVMAMQEDR